jgi:hypothetical protein
MGVLSAVGMGVLSAVGMGVLYKPEAEDIDLTRQSRVLEEQK